jgi:hypothetical protein
VRSSSGRVGGSYEKFRTSEMFDGTTKNPKWLETASL